MENSPKCKGRHPEINDNLEYQSFYFILAFFKDCVHGLIIVKLDDFCVIVLYRMAVP